MTTTHVYIDPDKESWTGVSSRILYDATGKANLFVVTSLSDRFLHRFHEHHIETIKCSLGQMFGALNLSRALRNIPGDLICVKLFSPELKQLVFNAISLAKAKKEITFEVVNSMPEVPTVKVEHPQSDNPPAFMWLGNITPECGLSELIDYLAKYADKEWTLRIVGEGKASVVSPILKLCKKHNLTDKIQWVGYSANPFKHMNGITHGIDLRKNIAESIVSKEFTAADIPIITELTHLSDLIK